MKKAVCVWIYVLSLMLPLTVSGQLLVGLGFQAGYNKMPNSDIPVDRFNSRGFLYRQMRHFRWPAGEIYAVSLRPGRLLLDLNLNTRRQRVSAESFEGSILHRRDVRFSTQAISLGIGYAVASNEENVLYLGGSFEAGYMRLLTRMGPKETLSRSNYQPVAVSPSMAATVFAKIVFRKDPESVTVFSFTPYFQYPFREFDFLMLNQILNTANWQLDGTSLPARPVNFGVAFNFDIDLLRFLVD